MKRSCSDVNDEDDEFDDDDDDDVVNPVLFKWLDGIVKIGTGRWRADGWWCSGCAVLLGVYLLWSGSCEASRTGSATLRDSIWV